MRQRYFGFSEAAYAIRWNWPNYIVFSLGSSYEVRLWNGAFYIGSQTREWEWGGIPGTRTRQISQLNFNVPRG